MFSDKKTKQYNNYILNFIISYFSKVITLEIMHYTNYAYAYYYIQIMHDLYMNKYVLCYCMLVLLIKLCNIQHQYANNLIVILSMQVNVNSSEMSMKYKLKINTTTTINLYF